MDVVAWLYAFSVAVAAGVAVELLKEYLRRPR